MAYYWISPAEVRTRTNQDGDTLAYRKDKMPFRLKASEAGEPGQIPVLNWDDAACWTDGSVEFRRAVLVKTAEG
jgi:hypothetical protein